MRDIPVRGQANISFVHQNVERSKRPASQRSCMEKQNKFLWDSLYIRLLSPREAGKEALQNLPSFLGQIRILHPTIWLRKFKVDVSRQMEKVHQPNRYLIRSSSKASASNLTGSLLPSNEAAFFTINRNVQTCALKEFRLVVQPVSKFKRHAHLHTSMF